MGKKLQDELVVQWLGLATIEQAQDGGMVYVRGHCTEQESVMPSDWRGGGRCREQAESSVLTRPPL